MLTYLGLGRDFHVDIGGFKVPKPVIWLWMLFTQVYFAGMQVIVIIINHAGGLPAILFPAHCISLIIMKSTIYTVLVLKTKKMWELMDYLQDVVNIRRLKHISCLVIIASPWIFVKFSIFWLSSPWINSLPPLPVGCGLSEAAKTIYEERNSRELRIVQMIFAGMSFLVCFSYLPAAVCWILTLIIGHPSPDFWSVPLSTEQAWVLRLTERESWNTKKNRSNWVFPTKLVLISRLKGANIRFPVYVRFCMRLDQRIILLWMVYDIDHCIFDILCGYLYVFSTMYWWFNITCWTS